MAKSKKNSIPDIVKVPRTDAIYNCHGYLTKVPVGAIVPFIEQYSRPGETVADLFAGSGMTGIAAAISSRNAHVSDISVLGQHIAQGFLTNVNPQELTLTSAEVVSSVSDRIGEYYQTIRVEDGKQLEIVRTIWSFVYACPKCSYELIFFDHVNKPKNEIEDICPECGEKFKKRVWNSNGDVPVRVVVVGVDGKQVEQKIQQIDLENIAKASIDTRLKNIPSLAIDPDREMYSRSGLNKRGLSETKHFFLPRNAIVLKELWEEISNVEDSAVRKKLQFAFTAILPRASKRYQWSRKRPLNAQNQTYYISPVYYEWNVFALFLRKVKAAIRSDELIFGNGDLVKQRKFGDVTYNLTSADSLDHIQSESIDYIFTDPPFGSNIFYSDMSLFHEAWLGQVTDNEKEAVIHTCGSKKDNAEDRYEQLLKDAFQEAYRILKPGRYMSVIFGNSKGRVWSFVLRALREAGFDSVPAHVAILDKGQRSVKGLRSGSESVVTVDLIMTVHKPKNKSPGESSGIWKQAESEDLIKSAVKDAGTGDANNPSYVYAKVLREAIRQHLLVDKLHLSDVLVSLRQAGYSIDPITGLFISPS